MACKMDAGSLENQLSRLTVADSEPNVEDTAGGEEEEEGDSKALNLTPEERTKQEQWKRQQHELKLQLVEEDSEEVQSWGRGPGGDPFANLHHIAGVDISFEKGSSHACAMLVILSFPELKVQLVSKATVEMVEPYIPGFLAFREVGFLLGRLEDVRQHQPHLMPQAILVDGNGVLHPRGFGLASHLGVLSGIPCVGVGKKLFHTDGLERSPEHREKIQSLLKKGDHFPLRGRSGRVWGVTLRTSDSAPNPVYVSVGHKISLDTATQLVIACSVKRVPEPIRQADILSREHLRTEKNKSNRKENRDVH